MNKESVPKEKFHIAILFVESLCMAIDHYLKPEALESDDIIKREEILLKVKTKAERFLERYRESFNKEITSENQITKKT